MANLISNATGNFTAAGTWLVADTTSASLAGTTNTNVTTGNLDSVVFVPGAITVRGIALQLSRRIGTTGTFTVTLRNTTGSIDAASVTINTADFPAETLVMSNASAVNEGSWHFFDFGSNILLIAATNYVVRVTTNTSTMIGLLSGASNDWNRLLATTTTGAPAAGDRMFIGQNYLSAGSATTRTVTMENNNTTAFGQIVCSNGGTFTASVAAATQLRQSGNYQAFGGSTTNWGTSGTPAVLGQATIWEMNTASDGQYGWEFYWNAAVSFYGATKTAVINTLAADASAAATSLTLGTTVGATWKNGDVIALAGTTRTAAETESKALGADASGTAVGTIAALTSAHSGTAPTAGHVCNLSRDLKLRTVGGSTTTNGTYMWWSPNYTGTAVVYYTEFAQFGANAALKRGVETDAIAGTIDFEFNSIHDFTEAGAQGFFALGGSGLNYTYSNNIIYNYRSGFTNTATTATGWTVNGNITLASGAGGPGFVMNDVGGTFTNNVAAGCTTTAGISVAEPQVAIGTFSGNTTYNNAVPGLAVTQYMSGTILNHTSWRNNTFGVTVAGQNSYSGAIGGLVFDTYTCFGNTTAGSQGATCVQPVVFVNGVWNAGVTLTQPVGHSTSANTNFCNFTFRTCSFGVTTTHATGDFNFNTTSGGMINTENCLLSSATPVAGATVMSSTSSFVRHDKFQQVAGSWLATFRVGTLQQDTVIFDAGTQSVKMTPTSATIKLQSDPFFVPVASGKAITITARVRKGTSYNGNQQRLMLRANSAMGINTDTVIATAAAAIASWETLTGTTAAASQNGTFEFFIDNDGTAGTSNYATMSATSS